jgi:hypothetical protein
MTVAEVLHFNAELRLPASVEAGTRRQFVTDVLRLLELTPISDSVVGPPGGGLSFEELKRVTIGAEVVANPSIVFLDEVGEKGGETVDCVMMLPGLDVSKCLANHSCTHPPPPNKKKKNSRRPAWTRAPP